MHPEVITLDLLALTTSVPALTTGGGGGDGGAEGLPLSHKPR